MRERFQATGVVLLALAGNCLYASVVGVPHAEFRHVYPLGENGRVVIHNVYGDVRITAWDRDEVLVEAIKHSADPDQLDDARIVVEPSEGALSIRTQYAGADANRPASVEYRITVPRFTNLQCVRLINGGLSISGVAGPVKASSVNGNIKAEKLAGEADLSTVNGQLEANFEHVSRAKPISLSSVNGPIHLSLPSGAGASVYARNRSGGIDSDVGQVHRASSGHSLVVRRGGPVIHLVNVNGGISIRSLLARHRAQPNT